MRTYVASRQSRSPDCTEHGALKAGQVGDYRTAPEQRCVNGQHFQNRREGRRVHHQVGVPDHVARVGGDRHTQYAFGSCTVAGVGRGT